MSAAAAGAYEEAKARLREDVVHHDGKKVYAIVEEGE
jgi:hypothetical protein